MYQVSVLMNMYQVSVLMNMYQVSVLIFDHTTQLSCVHS